MIRLLTEAEARASGWRDYRTDDGEAVLRKAGTGWYMRPNYYGAELDLTEGQIHNLQAGNTIPRDGFAGRLVQEMVADWEYQPGPAVPPCSCGANSLRLFHHHEWCNSRTTGASAV